MGAEAQPRRFLIATAVAHYKNAPAWDRPGLVEARQRVIDLFVDRFGYQHVSDLGLDPTEHQLTEQLRAFCKSSERREDDVITVYLAGHGEVLDEDQGGGHVLLTHDTDPDDIADALPTETLARKMLSGTRVRRLLLMLDTCYSGQGGNEMAAAALARMSRRWASSPGSGLVILSSAQPLEQAATGAFPTLLSQAVTDEATAGYGPHTLALDAVVQRMNAVARHQRVTLTQVGLAGSAPSFLPNPRHDPQLTEVDLAVQQEALWQLQADRRDVEFHSRLLVRAKGYSGPGTGWWFSGRRTALADITAWLSEPHDSLWSRPVLSVTGGPGSGKTAVLGILAALAHPELRRTVPVTSLHLKPSTVHASRLIDIAVYAQNLTDQQVLDALAASAKIRADTVGELLEALSNRPRPLTVLLDGLDEATTPDSLCTGIIRPLIHHAHGRIRLLIGTRPHLLPRLGLDRNQQVDLDTEHYADPEAVRTYTMRNLKLAHPASPYRTCPPHLTRTVADAVADAAGRSFLVARLAAGTLASVPDIPDLSDSQWRQNLPRHAHQAMAKDLAVRLGTDAARAMDLLRPLAYAQGQGLPWEDLWADLASSTSGRHYTDADISWLREIAGAYIVEAVEDGRSAYRLYHQALAEHLRNATEDATIHAAIARTLADHVPYSADGTPDWPHAHPYALRYLAAHAALGNVLDEILTDAEFLVHADPNGLMPYLHTAKTERSSVPAAVYRTSVGTHRRASTAVRRQILALDAARYNSASMLTQLNHGADDDAWMPISASGGTLSPSVRDALAGHNSSVEAVACTQIDNEPVAVSGDADGTVRLWNLSTGRPLGHAMSGPTGSALTVACTHIGGTPVAVSGSIEGTIRIWDLATQQLIGAPVSGHTSAVTSIACTRLGERSVAVTASEDMTVRLWDLTTREQIGEPMTGHTGAVTGVTCSILKGQQVAVTVSSDTTVRVWDLTTRLPFCDPLQGRSWPISAVACTRVDDHPVALATSGEDVWIWDLTTGQFTGKALAGHTGGVTSIATMHINGRPVAVTGAEDETVRVWDLKSRKEIDRPLSGHAGFVFAVACTDLLDRPIVVSGSGDKTVRVWDIAARQRVGQPKTGHTDLVTALHCTVLEGRSVSVSASDDGTARIWDLSSGLEMGEPLVGSRGPIAELACTHMADRPIAVTASGSHVQIWDLATRRPLGKFFIDDDYVHKLACTHINGLPIVAFASSDVLEVWALDPHQPTARQYIAHDGLINALACTQLEDRPIAVTGCPTGLRILDLITGKDIVRPPAAKDDEPISAVACTQLDGRPVTVVATRKSLRLLNLATGQLISEHPLAREGSSLSALACAQLDQQLIATVTTFEGTVHLYDLLGTGHIGTLFLPAFGQAAAITEDGFLVCSFGNDVSVFRRMD